MSLILRHYKPPKNDPRRDSAYLAWLRKLPCIVCGKQRFVEAAHVGERGLGQKCPDRQALPLCSWHHRMGPESQHVLGRNFFQKHGLNRFNLIAEYNRKYELSHAGVNRKQEGREYGSHPIRNQRAAGA